MSPTDKRLIDLTASPLHGSVPDSWPREGSSADIRISPAALKLRDRLILVRRDLHRHPEPGLHEVRTAGIAAERLRSLGCRVRTGLAQTGVIGDLGAGTVPRTLLVRFDMDALPVIEASGADYTSTVPGWMHACGHDGHTSIGLALAEALQDETIPGTVRLLFQPAEEGPGGALPMIEQGALDDPEVDACLGMHLWTDMPLGTVSARSGPVMSNVTLFEIMVRGRGGHAAAPHQAADALLATSSLVVGLQSIVSRNVDPLASGVLTIGTFQSGTAHNIIAGEAVLTGTIRTFEGTTQETMVQRLNEMCRHTASAFGCTAEVKVWSSYPAVVNDAGIAGMVRAAAAEVVGTDGVKERVWMAGEDMGYFLQRRPGCYLFVGAANEELGLIHPHHSPHFNFDEDAMLVGLEILLRSVRAYFAQSDETKPAEI